MEEIYKDEYEGFTVIVVNDPEPYSPREDDNFGKMVCAHSRYHLGDVKNITDASGVISEMVEAICEENPKEYELLYEDWHTELHVETQEGLDEVLERLDKYLIILPVYIYDHGGISLNTTGFSCRWDSGQTGFIFVSKQRAKREFGWKRLTKKRRERVEELLRNEVDDYSWYVSGQAYGYKIIDSEGEEVDSCYGFLGDDKHAAEDARMVIDSINNRRVA